MLWCIHPDPAIGQSLAATMRQAWPDMPCEAHTPEALPVPGPHCIALVSSPISSLPPERIHVLGEEPQRLKQILKKLQNMLRQTQWPAAMEFGDCRLNTRTREWQCAAGDAVMLTEKEVGILVYLWQGERPATRDDLLRDVWEYAQGVDTHTIETHIYRLRQKIEIDPGAPKILVTGKDGYYLSAIKPKL